MKQYHATNGVYKSQLCKSHCDARGQTISFCGVPAHHQNPVAENLNRRATDIARMLIITVQLHSRRLEKLADFDLNLHCSLAMEYAFSFLTNLPIKDQNNTTFYVFAHQKNSVDLNLFQAWGCPVYVLNPWLAASRKIPRWDPRSRKCFYLGFSRSYASSVVLILNLQTSKISLQFHLVFDESFYTVKPKSSVIESEWDSP